MSGMLALMACCSDCGPSPMPRPPMAMPSKARLLMNVVDFFLSSRSVPPCAMPKHNWFSRVCALRKRSAHACVFCTASMSCSCVDPNRGWQSRAMMTSAPSCCSMSAMDSGVARIFVPSNGLLKSIPSSVVLMKKLGRII